MVVIEMENGKQIEIELYPEIAPISCENFEKLVKQGFYDGLIFHRVIEGFMIQGGCPDGTGMGGPGWHIKGICAGFCRVAVLHHACRCTLSGRTVCSFRQGSIRNGCGG